MRSEGASREGLERQRHFAFRTGHLRATWHLLCSTWYATLFSTRHSGTRFYSISTSGSAANILINIERLMRFRAGFQHAFCQTAHNDIKHYIQMGCPDLPMSHRLTTFYVWWEANDLNSQVRQACNCRRNERTPEGIGDLLPDYQSPIGAVKADSHIACRAHVAPMPFRYDAPLPCSDSAVSFAKFRVVAGNIRTASPAV